VLGTSTQSRAIVTGLTFGGSMANYFFKVVATDGSEDSIMSNEAPVTLYAETIYRGNFE
jgi:hypothetical protein